MSQDYLLKRLAKLRVEVLEVFLLEIVERLEMIKERRKPHFNFKVGPYEQKKGECMALSIELTNEQKVKVTVTPVTPSGQPATLDGVPTWEVAAGDVTLEVASDGLSAYILSGLPGDSTVVVSADADLGSGVVTISDAVEVHVVGALASSLGLSASAPEPK